MTNTLQFSNPLKTSIICFFLCSFSLGFYTNPAFERTLVPFFPSWENDSKKFFMYKVRLLPCVLYFRFNVFLHVSEFVRKEKPCLFCSVVKFQAQPTSLCGCLSDALHAVRCTLTQRVLHPCLRHRHPDFMPLHSSLFRSIWTDQGP